MTRSGGSLRMQTRIAVEAVIGSSPRTRPATGVTAATGSRAKRMINRPMVAFQKLITVQGSVIANSTTSAQSRTPNVPADSAMTSSQTMPMSDRATSAKNNACRRASGSGGAASAAASWADRSSMQGLACVPVQLPV